MHEATRIYSVTIKLPDGKVISRFKSATSKWHAIELLFTELQSEQPDRSKYK